MLKRRRQARRLLKVARLLAQLDAAAAGSRPLARRGGSRASLSV